MLKAAERRYGLLEGVARCLVDDRQAGKVRHSLRDLVAQRVFGLACGYPDANDAERLGDDPIRKLLLDRAPRFLYETVYCRRGDIENRIKELHHGLEIDRTSCGRFWANQLRVLLTAAAYVLLQEVRLRARGTALARAQVWTLREALFTLGTRVVRSVRRLVLHLPRAYPHLAAWRLIACRLGAAAG